MGVTLTAVRRGLTAVGRQLRFGAFTESSTSESVTVTRTPSRPFPSPGLGPGPGPGPGVDAVLFPHRVRRQIAHHCFSGLELKQAISTAPKKAKLPD